MTYVDDSILNTVSDVTNRWGGKDQFEIQYIEDWRGLITSWKKTGGIIVHLTMYGLEVDKIINHLNIEKRVLVVVGASKVPRGVYSMADYNLAIGHQPHSEISALAIFLDRLFKGDELKKYFKDAKIVITPSKEGKRVRLSD